MGNEKCPVGIVEKADEALTIRKSRKELKLLKNNYLFWGDVTLYKILLSMSEDKHIPGQRQDYYSQEP
jgi:hypothetical protein